MRRVIFKHMLPNGGFKKGFKNGKKVCYPFSSQKKHKKSNLLVISISIALILLAIGAGGYFYLVLTQDKKIGDILESLEQFRQSIGTLREPPAESTPTDETTGLTPEVDTIQVFDSSEYKYSYFADMANELIKRLRE